MLQIKYRKISELKPYPNNARKHPPKQLQKLAANIKAIDFIVPVIIDAQDTVLAGHGRLEAAKMAGLKEIPAVQHPTVKPASMVMDALRDCSNRGHFVLDPFGGSGTTLIAAEKTGREARLIELDPIYCDMIVRRWEKYTSKKAFLEGEEATFEEVKQQRMPKENKNGR